MSRQIEFDLLAAADAKLWQSHLAAIEDITYISDDEAPEQHTVFADRLLCACSLYKKFATALIEEHCTLYREHLRGVMTKTK